MTVTESLSMQSSNADRSRGSSNKDPRDAVGPEPQAGLATDDALRRIRGEYLEMPGLRLTALQAQRLWNLDRIRCEVLLSALVDTKFLWRTVNGAFVRCDSNSPVRTEVTRLTRRVSSINAGT